MTPEQVANAQILQAFGLDHRRVRSFMLELDSELGPVATVELYESVPGVERQGTGPLAWAIQHMKFVAEPDATRVLPAVDPAHPPSEGAQP